MTRICYPAHPEVPISKAVRAGDFVFTSAYGPWTFDPKHVAFDADGIPVDDGAGRVGMDFASQVHGTFAAVGDALAVAGCSFADVVDCEVWLADARDFVRFNEIYRGYFDHDPPARSVFTAGFMFPCKIEMKMRAYRPVAA